MTLLAYRFALDPTPAQVRVLRSHAGAARVAFNWGLSRVKANLGQREAEKSYGLARDELTPSLSWSLYSLRKDWNQAKAEVAPWWGECSKEAFNTGLDGLARALKNWNDSRKGTRRGRRMGFPKFRSRRKAKLSIRFTTGAIRCELGHAVLPRLGRIRLHEAAGALTVLLDAGAARVLSATVRHERGRWFVSFSVEQADDVVRPAALEPDAVVGVDVGIKTLMVLSGGRGEVENPKNLQAAQRKIRRLSRAMSRRQGPDRCTRQVPSRRWERASRALSMAHGRVKDLRRDAIHKATTDLTGRFGTIVVEDLNVAGMTRNKRLARALSDASFGDIRRQIEYKAAWRGGRVIVADRWFASSKTCSGCGAVKAKLLLSERTYVCAGCGLVKDRDDNAADVLEQYGRQVAASGAETVNGRGADRETGPSGTQVAVKRQPGRTAPAVHETGTVPTQEGTAA